MFSAAQDHSPFSGSTFVRGVDGCWGDFEKCQCVMVRCEAEAEPRTMTRPSWLARLAPQGDKTYTFFRAFLRVLNSSFEECLEQGVRAVRAALEFRVELCAEHEGMVFQFHNLCEVRFLPYP